MPGITQAQDSPFGQTFQINTRLNSYIGKPSWLIIVRDEMSGRVLPFLYDFNSTDNFWLGVTFTRAYRVIVSELEFGPPNAVIHNFCHLQDGIMDRESFTVTLTGNLTPNRHTSTCHVLRYKVFSFPVATPEDDTPEPQSSNAPAALPATPAAPATATSNITNAISSAVNNAVSNGVAGGVSNAVGNLLAGTNK
jgi:hypothetical protein